MLESLGKSISAVVDERLANPFVSSFVIAWSLYNYKFFVILVSAAGVTETFRLIQQISFPDWKAILFDGFLIPLSAVFFYVFLLPYPSKLIYEKWRQTNKEINAIKQRIDGDSLLTIDESRQMRAQERALYAKIDEANNEINKLRDDLRQADQNLRDAKDVAENALAKASHTRNAIEKSTGTLTTAEFDELAKRLRTPRASSNFKLHGQDDSPEDSITVGQVDLLSYIHSVAPVTTVRLLSELNTGDIKKSEIDALASLGYVQRQYEDQEETISVTSAGRALLRKEGFPPRQSEFFQP